MGLNERERRALAYIDDHSDELFGDLLRLLAARSENFISDGNEMACAELVRDMYEELGLETELYYPDDCIRGVPDYLPGRGTDHRPNVGGVLRGSDGARGIMLAAHTDTMPVGDESEWTVNPLGERKDGRIYGRGAGDNKCGVAVGAFLVRALRKLGIRLRQNVVLSAYCDEEYGGGNGSIASCVKYPCDMYINLDGGNGGREIWTCGVGGQAFRIEVAARSVQDTAVPVLEGLWVAKRRVQEFGRRRDAEVCAHPLYGEFCKNNTITRIHAFRCGDRGVGLSSGRLDFVFYTVSERRAIEAELKAVEEGLRAELDRMNLDLAAFAPTSRYFDYVRADESDPSIRLLLECASEVEGHPVVPAGACLTDYFLYYKHGSPLSVTYGIFRDFSLPGGAHQPDEYVEEHALVNHAKALALFLLRWSGCDGGE